MLYQSHNPASPFYRSSSSHSDSFPSLFSRRSLFEDTFFRPSSNFDDTTLFSRTHRRPTRRVIPDDTFFTPFELALLLGHRVPNSLVSPTQTVGPSQVIENPPPQSERQPRNLSDHSFSRPHRPSPSILHPTTAHDFDPEEEGVKRKKEMEKRIALFGLKEKTPIAGDGNCQFAAVSDQMYDSPKYHAGIRLLFSISLS